MQNFTSILFIAFKRPILVVSAPKNFLLHQVLVWFSLISSFLHFTHQYTTYNNWPMVGFEPRSADFGSCAPTTAEFIQFCLNNIWVAINIDSFCLFNNSLQRIVVEPATKWSLASFRVLKIKYLTNSNTPAYVCQLLIQHI